MRKGYARAEHRAGRRFNMLDQGLRPQPPASGPDPTQPARPDASCDNEEQEALSIAARSPRSTVAGASEAARNPGNLLMGPVPAISNHNHNTNVNCRDVVNNNSVTNNVYLTNEKDIVKTIQAAIGNRFVRAAMHETQPEESGCLPGTRLSVLSMLLGWTKSDPMRIFWLAGLAGTGKTAIAVTLCRMLQDEPTTLLGGAFFCSRTVKATGLTDVHCIIPTLVVSLALQSPLFAAALAEVLDRDSLATSKPISAQINALLQQPLSALPSSALPIVFIIDALDECSEENEVKKLLKAISTFTCDTKIKFIITARPETHISTSVLSTLDFKSVLRLHTLDKAAVAADILLYMNDTFSRQPLGEPWYTESDVNTLVTRADGLFIFASTVIAYVLDTEFTSERVARLRTAAFSMKESKVATATLDNMYEFVLTRASNTVRVETSELEATQQVLACILMARMPLSIAALAEILGWTCDALRASLRRLHAVVNVPNDTYEPDLRTVHASFGDYLFERATAGLRIAATLGDEGLARGCLGVMKKQLHFNISQSSSSHEPNTPATLGSVSRALNYACLQWIYHIAGLPQPWIMDADIDDIFRLRFLFWLEVMSILNQLPRAAAALIFAAKTVRSAELSQFLRDANIFVASSREAIERSAPHIYLSALPFAAKDSLIYTTFMPLCSGIISVETFGIERHGGRLVTTLGKSPCDFAALSYASDGRLIAGSSSGELYIWDLQTSDEAPFPSYFDEDCGGVFSIAVASDGQTFALGTGFGTVCIWDLQASQDHPRELLGHSDVINSVAFSHNDLLIASASDDESLRLWEVKTGRELCAMTGDVRSLVTFVPRTEILAFCYKNEVRFCCGRTGDPATEPVLRHDDRVWSFCFSPDGTALAVGLFNSEIRLWDTTTWINFSTLRGHSDLIVSIQFSPSGASLVSASDDGSVILWNLVRTPYEAVPIVSRGLLNMLMSVVFSPDGMFIATISECDLIHVWDARDGQDTVEPFQAHRESVTSVSTTTDGAFIVSSSYDRSVRIWDARTGEAKFPQLLGHTDPVRSAAVSSDGLFIASTSEGHALRMWDTRTGEDVTESLEDYTCNVDEVTFSPDGRWLASGSTEDIIHIWDVMKRRKSAMGPLRCEKKVLSVIFSPNGHLVAAGDKTGTIYVWNTDNGQLARRINNCSNISSTFPIAFSPASTHVVFAGDDGVGQVWDLGVAKRTLSLKAKAGCISSVSFSPNGRLICTGSGYLGVCLWDAATGEQLAALPVPADSVSSIAFTPDGLSIVSAYWGSTIRVWDVEGACAQSSKDESDFATVLASNKFDCGWLLGRAGELLLWVPKVYRNHLNLRNCKLLIAQHRVTINTGAHWHHGSNWRACWHGSDSL